MELTDARWAGLEPLVETCRPHAKVPPPDLRRTVEAIIRRRRNGARWQAVAIGSEKDARSCTGVLCRAAGPDWLGR